MLSISGAGIGIVIPVSSSKYIPYLNNCLASINAQQNVDGLIDITLVYTCLKDSVSRDEQVELLDFCQRFYSVFPTSLLWFFHEFPDYPLAFARNAGARNTRRDIIGFIDSDLVLDPRILQKVIEFIPKYANAVCVNVYRMPQEPNSYIFRELTPEMFEHNLRTGRRDNAGKGGCFFIERSLFEQIHGYDERLYGWGWEDNDLFRRLDNYKKKIVNLTTERIFAMHQFHEHKKDYKSRYEQNRLISIQDKSIIRNPKEWGGLPV